MQVSVVFCCVIVIFKSREQKQKQNIENNEELYLHIDMITDFTDSKICPEANTNNIHTSADYHKWYLFSLLIISQALM